MDLVARGEAVEGELVRLIERRHDQRVTEEGERPAEAAYVESARRFHVERQEALAWQWRSWHIERRRANKATFAVLDAHHRAEIERYEKMLGIDSDDPRGPLEAA